jgi:hypothetical protein
MTRKVLVVIGIAGALALTGCGLRAGQDSAATEQEITADVSTEGAALVAMGFAPADVTAVGVETAPTPEPSGKADRLRDRHRAKVLLRRNVLHGEAVVQGKDGVTRTVVVQRGTVTAVDASTITVRSADGFTLTWTFGTPLHVIEHRTSIQPKDVAVGSEVGIAGAKEGDKTVARLIVIPNRR